MGIFDKLRDLKFEVEMKASDIRYAVSDKFDDVKDFVGDRVDDVKDFAGDTFKVKSKGDVAEIAANVLFPAQIPVKMILSRVGKSSSSKIKGKNDELSKRILMLEAMQAQGEYLENEIKGNLTIIQSTKTQLQSQLTGFAELFGKIHNRPTFKITSGEYNFTAKDLFNIKAPGADFAKLDGLLVDMYGEDAGILQGLFRTPVFAAILKFREKALMNQIENVLDEVDSCVDNMRPLVQYLMKINVTSRKFAKELVEFEAAFRKQLVKLTEIVGRKTDFHQFSEQEKVVLDTTIKLVGVVVKLMNTHIFDAKVVSDKGFTKVNTVEVAQKIKESEEIRKSA